MTPFKIRISDRELGDLYDRLKRTRWPGEVAGSGWDYGTNLAYLRQLCEHWLDGFDWRAREAHLNRLSQVKVKAGGLDIHAVLEKGRGPAPMPLVLTHGWPSTFYELDKVIGPLSDPAAHGGDPADAFDVVVPSLPGYGFSEVPTARGMSPARVADIWAELMMALGYETFGAHGGDWGAFVTALLGHRHPGRLRGIHMTMMSLVSPRPEGAERPPSERTPAQSFWVAEETGYQAIQGTKPQTLAYGLTDSPAGLAGWIVEKWRTWSDCKGDVESRFTKDELLTTIAIYWFTGTINSSTRLYYEARHDPTRLQPGERVDVPTGFAMFPTLGIPPRERAERTFDLRRWTEMDRGGHFAAFEEPELLVNEIREFFRPLR
jgi:pimeloyl-ACP methyl ester carboxylesterase